MQFNWPMPPDTRMSEEAAAGMIGQQIAVTGMDGVTYYATVVNAVVKEDGQSVVIDAQFQAPEFETLLYAQ